MKQRAFIMGMPIEVAIVDTTDVRPIKDLMEYFRSVDRQFSPYKEDSEVSQINSGKLRLDSVSPTMQEILHLSEQTKKETFGYFDVHYRGFFNPSGIVKGWAIHHAAEILRHQGYTNFYVDAGGDIELSGRNEQGLPWRVGIRNPNNTREIVKIVSLTDCGIATSGTYERGDHIYNPHPSYKKQNQSMTSLTVIAENVYEADRFATAAFAMGDAGMPFLGEMKHLQAYGIYKNGMAAYTQGFDRFILSV